MCCECWDEKGSPRIDNERVRAAQALIAAVYEYKASGGNLHIALDDNNLEDEHLEFCSRQIARGGHPEDPDHCPWYTKSKLDDPDSPEQLAAERVCCDALMAMSLDERVSALAIWDGCWDLRDRAQAVDGLTRLE